MIVFSSLFQFFLSSFCAKLLILFSQQCCISNKVHCKKLYLGQLIYLSCNLFKKYCVYIDSFVKLGQMCVCVSNAWRKLWYTIYSYYCITPYGNIRKVNRILHRFFPFQLKILKITPLRKLSTITSVYFSLQKCCLVHRNPLVQANRMVCLILSWS